MIQTNGTGALYRLKGEIRVKNWRTYCVFGRKDRVYYVSLLPFVHMFIWYVSDTTYGLGYKKVVETSAKKVQEHQSNTKRRCMSIKPTQKHPTKKSHKVGNDTVFG
eukprot:306322_1